MKKKSTIRPPGMVRRGDGSARPRTRPAQAAATGLKRTKARTPADPKPLTRPGEDLALAIRRLRRQLAEAMSQIAQLQAHAETDALLGVLNRRGFERELTRASAYLGRYRASAALVVLDVDRLKPINDALGHAAGDAVLKAVVSLLQAQIRSSDVIGRLGGDEFVLLLWNLTAADAVEKARQLETIIDGLSITFKGVSISVGVSAGVAPLGPQTVAAAALEHADRAMYARKAERRTAP